MNYFIIVVSLMTIAFLIIVILCLSLRERMFVDIQKR